MRDLDSIVRPAMTGPSQPGELGAIVTSLHEIEQSLGVPMVDVLRVLADNLAAAPSTSVSRMMTADQEAALRAAGSFVDEMPPLEERASTTALHRTGDLLATALSTDEAAVRLGVTAGRVRQRLSNRTLLAVKVGAAHRLPAFQFTDDGELPGWDRVAPAFPSTAHPTAVAWFMQTPHPDLTAAGESLSPSQWLAGGGDIDRVVHLITTAFAVHAS
jgi:excisionase family DNA binding protein